MRAPIAGGQWQGGRGAAKRRSSGEAGRRWMRQRRGASAVEQQFWAFGMTLWRSPWPPQGPGGYNDALKPCFFAPFEFLLR